MQDLHTFTIREKFTANAFLHLQCSRPLTLVRDIIQTRNRRFKGKSKKEGKKSVLTQLLLAPLPSAGSTAMASHNNLYSTQLSSDNYNLSAPSTSYEQPPVSAASASGYTPAQHHVFAGEGKQQREEYVCEDNSYRYPDGVVEIMPGTMATTTAASPPCVVRAGTGHQATHAELPKDTNMTAMPSHGSTDSAFSPFASNHCSMLLQSPSQRSMTHSPLLGFHCHPSSLPHEELSSWSPM